MGGPPTQLEPTKTRRGVVVGQAAKGVVYIILLYFHTVETMEDHIKEGLWKGTRFVVLRGLSLHHWSQDAARGSMATKMETRKGRHREVVTPELSVCVCLLYLTFHRACQNVSAGGGWECR